MRSGYKNKKNIKYKICEFTYRKRPLARHLSCLQRSFREVYDILNRRADCRR